MNDERKNRRAPANRQQKRPTKKPRPENRPEPVRAPAQEVVYTAPEPLNRKRLIIRIATVAAVVVALYLACSVFFKVENIKVSGNVKYDEWTVFEASGIEKGDSLLAFGKGKACARIAQKLPYVKIVRIGITLPNTVNIYVEELDVVYAVQDTNDGWWLLTSGGRVVEKTSASAAKDKTKLEGFRIENPVAGEGAKAYEPEPDTTADDEKPVTVTNQDRMDTALSIVTELERRGVLGQVASLNVEDMGKIELWYEDDYQVKLGNAGQMEKKIRLMCATISNQKTTGRYQRGILDISFEIYPEGVGFEPFQ